MTSANQLAYVLAVDLGTSGPKVALVSTQGDLLASEFEPTPVVLLPGGGAEQDPAAWWGAIVSAARRLLARGLVPVEDILGVCCTAQWSGTVAIDERGNALGNAIIWMDARGAPHVTNATSGLLQVEGYGLRKLLTWLRVTGGIPGHSGKDSIAHILYLKAEDPERFAAAHLFLEPKDYINARLTGRFAASYDSIALHWVTDNRDLTRVDYHPSLLAYVGLTREKLPDLLGATDILGPLLPEVAQALGLRPETVVVMGTPDVQSAAIGSGAVRDFEPHLYVGTSSWLTCHVPYKKTDLFHSMASLPSALPGRYFIANEQETAGKCLSFLRDQVFFPQDELDSRAPPSDVFARFDRLAATAAPGSDGLIFLPWLYGERTPIEDPDVRGGFFNLTLSTTRAQMVRAVLEGVAYNSRWLMQAVEKFIGRSLTEIRFIGGGAQSDIWCQIFADVLDRDILQVAEPIHANVRGAGILGAMALGKLDIDEVHTCVEVAKRYRPNPETRAMYDDYAAIFIQLYKQNRKLFHRLRHRG
ncbi:MAG: xylulokinase [Nannocystaceae bacterium]